MFSWFGYSNAEPQLIQQKEKIINHAKHQLITKSDMIITKVAPSVKSTSVNVIFDDMFVNNDSIYNEPEAMTSNEPFRSASISLSIELAKKSSMTSLNNNDSNLVKSKPIFFIQKPDNITPHSSLPKSMAIQKQLTKRSNASITSNSSNSLLQRMAHSPKASAAAFPTSVSANGNVVNDYYYYTEEEGDLTQHNQHENSIETNRSAAIESLSKKIISISNSSSTNNTTDVEEEEEIVVENTIETTNTTIDELTPVTTKVEILTPIVSTCKNNQQIEEQQGGFWSWFGFSSSVVISENESNKHEEQQQEITTNEEEICESPTTITEQPQQPSTSSWTSFLFSSSSKADVKQKREQEPTNSSIEPIPPPLIKNKPMMKEIKQQENNTIESNNNNLRKAKSTSSLPPAKEVILTPTQSLRYSSSNASMRPRKKNIVLPPFDSQFILTESSEAIVPPTPPPHQTNNNNNMLTKAIDAINSILIQSPPDQPEDTSNWIAKRMRAKFSNFVADMKSSDPKTIIDKRIVVVGVHGWFPMKLVRSMIGEPTGTSLKFCEQMAAGVKLYFQTEHGVTLSNDAITMVPLEGEGKVEDRVNQLYCKLIDNSSWLEAVSSADVILWATHSQGTPVSIMLLQRLLERGHVHIIRQSVCLLAMAGISHGPFPALKGSLIVKYFEADAARELFEFMDSSSSISQKFRQSLSYVLKCGLKVVLTGSMQDQVVPLYSAIMSSVNHSNILRSIYIDGHIYSQDDFLINLIVFALRLRNTGLPDYDLLVHLSEVLAGSLYALEGGHSTIYEELEVYMTAVRYTFETAPFGKYVRAFPSSKNESPPLNRRKSTPPPISRKTSVSAASSLLMNAMTSSSSAVEVEEVKMESFQAKQQQNPFYLPWALHGICSDPMILADEVMKKDLARLLNLFEQWNPTSSRLRELKFRLDPLRTIKLSF